MHELLLFRVDIGRVQPEDGLLSPTRLIWTKHVAFLLRSPRQVPRLSYRRDVDTGTDAIGKLCVRA